MPISAWLRRLSAFDLFYIGLSSLSYAAMGKTVLALWQPRPVSTVPEGLVVSGVLVACFVVIAESLSTTATVYFGALAAHALVTVAAIAGFPDSVFISYAATIVFLLGVSIHNRYPLNFALAGPCAVGLILVRLTVRGYTAAAVEDAAMQVGVTSCILLFAVATVRYREAYIDLSRAKANQDVLTERLTRANLQYQDYVRSVEERTISLERKRVTRDIHDTVGYTLTNTITMMEAAMNLMQVNPLGVKRILEMARNNAVEGLEQVRAALRLLREKEIASQAPRIALEKMMYVFREATGIRLESRITGDMRALAEASIDAVYHIVQESLVNSLRHGKASVISVFLTVSPGTSEVVVRDNGVGSIEFSEGIGIAGMRERIARIGGSLQAGPVVGGFEIRASLPSISTTGDTGDTGVQVQ